MPRAANTQHATRNTKPLVSLLLAWFAKNARDLPWRRTSDPYAIWVSEIMLQQTQVKTVIPYWERWMRELPSIESLAKANPEKIHKLWEGLGYYTRVRNMQKAAQEIVAKGGRQLEENPSPENKRQEANELKTHPTHSIPKGLSHSAQGCRVCEATLGYRPVSARTLKGFRHPVHFKAQNKKSEPAPVGCYNFPKTFDEVLALPGIGRYTAGAICSIAYNQPTPILDGNVIRVLTRVFGISENPKDKQANERLWNLARELVVHATRNTQHAAPSSHLNQSLMELGALICTPRDPKCLVCPIAKKHCFAFKNHRVNDFPNLEKRAAPTARRFAAFVVERNGKFLVRQRPEGVVNAHLWEFPNVELNGEPVSASTTVKELFGFAPQEVKALCTIKHSITRYRITVEAYRVGAPSYFKVGQSCRSAPISRHAPSARDDSRWLSIPELHNLSFPSAHKKILKSINMIWAGLEETIRK